MSDKEAALWTVFLVCIVFLLVQIVFAITEYNFNQDAIQAVMSVCQRK